jgi:GNAT superfamily N-acetyltransferase
MNPFRTPMTWEEFDFAEIPLGWKAEYFDGYAHITPRHHGVMMKIKVEPREIKSSVKIELISATTPEDLSKLFYSSFVKSVEYVGCTKYRVKKASIREVDNFFAGKRGIPQIDLCKIAFFNDNLIGACLVSKYKFGFKDEILFVHPKHQRKGVGNALVSSVLNDLNNLGETIFWSEHHICNELSAKWHRKFGFDEVTDFMTLKYRRSYYKQEIYRLEHFGDFENIPQLKEKLEKVESEIKRIENLEEKDYRAAWGTWKYEY